MRILPLLSALAVLSVVTSCVGPPRRAVAPPPPPPVRVVAPPPPAAPAVLPTDWRDWPQTPGDWRYEQSARESVATFGTPGAGVFALRCDRPSRRVLMIRDVPTGGPATVRTSALTRVLAFAAEGGSSGDAVDASLAANDPLLDAMAFSRGRFVVDQRGAPPLVLPAWAEVGRVVEDCRG